MIWNCCSGAALNGGCLTSTVASGGQPILGFLSNEQIQWLQASGVSFAFHTPSSFGHTGAPLLQDCNDSTFSKTFRHKMCILNNDTRLNPQRETPELISYTMFAVPYNSLKFSAVFP